MPDVYAFLDRYHRWMWGLAALSGAVTLGLFWDFTVDDSYISHRYARNLVEYGVWNWNPEGVRVEAYTSALYAVLAILPVALGIPVAIFFKVFHLLLLVGVVYGLKQATDGVAFGFGGFFLGAAFFFNLHLFSGIETFGFMVALGGLAFLLLRARRSDELWLWLLGFVLPFIRPEGLFFALAAGLFWYFRWRSLRYRGVLALLIGLWLVYFFWRWHYFGYLLPNTFYFKAIQGSSVRNLPKNLLAIAFHGFPLLLLLLQHRCRAVGVLAGTAAAVGLLLYAPSSLQMNYAERFWVQLFWPLWLAHIFLIRDRKTLYGFVFTGLFLLLATNRDLNEWRRLSHYGGELHRIHSRTGQRLRPFRTRGYTLLTGDAGALPYFAGWHAVEFIGVANPHLTHRGWTPGYLSELAPELVVLYSRTVHPTGILSIHHQQEIYAWLKKQGTYELVAQKTWRGGDTYLYFLQRDIPDYEALRGALQQ